ncbi:cobalt ECF transporter T component CbiQ [uncultured Desulfosarcina sp.]|uniref:cobalt ECF transporter T component CbiQ n=1 Tax=uncultured Desulfosarcina sp. TaxID=218289 RepID=UPI0029C77BBF|nr:cobalt ECF transporter T component CbiQ [uncultured Desulfosarcina sp.]
MITESFAEGNSWIHGIDPRLRVIWASVFAVVVAVSYAFSALFIALSLSLIMALSARLDFQAVVRRLRAPVIFLILLWAVLPWSYEGDALRAWGPVIITRQGVTLCAQISLKTVSLMVAFMALVATMTVDTLGHTLNRLRLPDKMVHMILITYRYLFVIEQEYQRLVRAMKIRNFQPKTNLHSYRTYAYLVGMLFVRASERARRVHCAMICRGFNGRFVSLRVFPPQSRNYIFSLVFTLFLALLVTLEWVK